MYSMLIMDGHSLEELAKSPVGDAVCMKLRALAEQELNKPENEAVLRSIVQETIERFKSLSSPVP